MQINKIQAYSLEEIRHKHLVLFIPYTILRMRPKLKNKYNLTQKELTGFVKEAILVLKEELNDGFITELEYHDYVRLLYYAIDRVLSKHPTLLEEVYQVTEPLIKLPSVEIKELQAEIANQKAELANRDAKLKDMNAELKDKDAELKDKDAELKDKDVQIQSLQELIQQLSAK